MPGKFLNHMRSFHDGLGFRILFPGLQCLLRVLLLGFLGFFGFRPLGGFRFYGFEVSGSGLLYHASQPREVLEAPNL